MKSDLQSKALLIPIASLVGVIVLSVFAGNFVFSRFGPIRSKIAAIEAEKNALESKLTNLQQVNDDVLDHTETVYMALPSVNPGAVVLAQIRKIAQELKLNLVNVNVNSSKAASEEQINTTIIELKAEGEYKASLEFIKRLATIAPVVNLVELKSERTIADQIDMNMTVHTYWASLPQTLPQINESVQGLNDDEINLISKLAELTKPEFSELEPKLSTEGGRVNPFDLEN